jgi:murein DD-endopeptidase MepM/ murein hydrolase activator NlpD
MNRFAWVGCGVLGALVVLAGSMVHIVPPDATAPPASVTKIRQEGAPVTLQEHALLTIPVQGVHRKDIVDTWGQSRANGARTHQATDIMAPGGTPVIAAATGTVEKLFYSNGGGGITLYERSPDRLWQYYYAHLQGYAPGIHEGQIVREGDLLGFVGDTGNAGAGNFHLHFGVSRMQPNEGWWQGLPVNPYPLLAGGGAGG